MSLELVAVQYNKATRMIENGNLKKAFPILKKLLQEYEFKEGLVNIGNCYRDQGNDIKQIECLKRALDPKVPYLEGSTQKAHLHALNNLGLAYYSIGDDNKAIDCYTKAIKEDDKFWEAWWNCSTATLRKASSGQEQYFDRGWEMYRARFLKKPPVKVKNNKEGLEYWDTISDGESMIVLTEQGIGDSIMWGRYLPELAKKFKKVYVQCDPSIESIFSEYNPVRDAIETDALLAYPICSLADCFNDGIPIAGDWLKGKYNARKFDEDRPNIGIVWAGNSGHANDAYRSVSIGRFSRFAKYGNLYGLSPGFTGTKHVKSLGIKNWTDTAIAINGLDLVIGVDTSVMHMCGALGREGWLLQPFKETDFRWGNGVDRCSWYDSIKIFENPASWEFVFDQVEEALAERFYEKC